MSDHHLIAAVEAGDLTMAEAFDIIKKGDDAHQDPERCFICGQNLATGDHRACV